MKTLRISMVLALTLLFAPPVSADKEVKAAIKVSSGAVYDYVIVGMSRQATDGFDNAYDTFTPGWGLSDSYIYAFIPHPEWGTVKDDFRGDIRAMKPSDVWQVGVETNLPPGTELTMSLMKGRTRLPGSYSVEVTDPTTGMVCNLGRNNLRFRVPDSGIVSFSVVLKKGKKK